MDLSRRKIQIEIVKIGSFKTSPIIRRWGRQVSTVSQNITPCRYIKSLHFSLETKSTSVEPRRWDPLTAVASASLAAAGDMDATVGIIRDPYKEYKGMHPSVSKFPPSRAESGVRDSQTSRMASVSKHANIESHQERERDLGDQSPTSKKNGRRAATAVVGAAVAGSGKVLITSSKATLVDLPLAATEGMRAVPRLYGRETKSGGQIKDFQSGVIVAGKNFGRGIYEGATDIFVETYTGKKTSGAAGAAKGLGKGVISFTAKTASGVVGLLAYPSQGAYHSMKKLVKSSTTQQILKAKIAEGDWLLSMETIGKSDDEILTGGFRH